MPGAHPLAARARLVGPATPGSALIAAAAGGMGRTGWQPAGFPAADAGCRRRPISCRLAVISRRGVKKGPENPISLMSADLRWPRGQPPMSHPAPHAGPVPAPPVSSGPAGTGDQQPGTAAGPGIGVPVSVWPAPGPVPGPGPEAAHAITAFSRPGELVVIPAAGTGALLTAAAAAGRRVLGLFPGPAACHAAGAAPGPGPRPGGAPAGTGPGRRARPAAGGRLPGSGTGRPGHHRPRWPRRRRAVHGVRAGATARRRPGPSSPPAPTAPPGCAMTRARSSPPPAPPGSSTPSTSSPCTPPSPAASSPRPPRRRPPGRDPRPPGRLRPHPQRPARVHQARRNPR